jgi:hypothetical protein
MCLSATVDDCLSTVAQDYDEGVDGGRSLRVAEVYAAELAPRTLGLRSGWGLDASERANRGSASLLDGSSGPSARSSCMRIAVEKDEPGALDKAPDSFCLHRLPKSPDPFPLHPDPSCLHRLPSVFDVVPDPFPPPVLESVPDPIPPSRSPVNFLKTTYGEAVAVSG